jgi:DNA-binding CsgD family transcriptional regulator
VRIEDPQRALAARLRGRQAEIERTVLVRIEAAGSISTGPQAPYAYGLRAAISAAVDYGLESIEQGGAKTEAVPPVLLTQARLACREGLSLDAVISGYLAGYTLLNDCLIEELESERQIRGSFLQKLLRAQAANFDRIVLAVSKEYVREQRSHVTSWERGRAERLRRLLDGEQLDISDFAYPLDGNHVALLAKGPEAASALNAASELVDCQLLVVERDNGTAWGWLGARHPFDSAELDRIVSWDWPPGVTAAVGEQSRGLKGWRTTHRQAHAALPIAFGLGERCVRYRDVALLASLVRDELVVESLAAIYLEPLRDGKDGGAIAQETLRAYLRTGQRTSSAASILGINRHTVASRIQRIEERLGRSINECAAEIETCLRLDELRRL